MTGQENERGAPLYLYERGERSMRAAGKKGQAEDIENLLSCIESMQGDLTDALDEVKYLREQIKTMQDKTMQAKHRTWTGSRPPYSSSALSHKRLNNCV